MTRKEDLDDRTVVQVSDPLVGKTFDRRFHIDFRIAIGGFGAIYHATHTRSGHQFALKILHPRLANDLGVVARFRREGETLTRLRNDHTIIAYEVGEADDGTLFIVLELLQGESLFERFRARGRFPWKEMTAIARGVCSSLEEAHALGIVHRDLKPTNINLESRDGTADFVKVLDFGIAKILRESEMDSQDLTNAGQMIGTLDYMSPEQMVGGACTGQTDIYTLGILVYEMISGRRPFAEANSPAAVLAAMLRTTPPPLSSIVPVPAGLDRVVMRCLERDPLKRWATVAQLGAALDAVLRGDEPDDVTRTVPVDLIEDSTVFEERPRSTAPYPSQVVGPKAARALGEAPTEPAPIARAPASRGSQPAIDPPARTAPSRGSQPALHTIARPTPTGATPTPVTTRKDASGPVAGRVPPANPASPTSDPYAPTVGVPNVMPAGPRMSMKTPYPASGAPTVAPYSAKPAAQTRSGGLAPQSGADYPTMGGPGAPTVAADPRSASAQTKSGSLAAPLPGSELALFPPPPPGQRKPPTGPPPMAVLAPPGPHVPLPYAPDRPVMDLASFPPQGYPPPPPGPGMPGYELAQIAAREAAVRRFVWFMVLAVAAIIGIVVATQL